MAYSATSQDRVLADINITPLVDVMLVLLVIFMIAAPTLSHRIELNLPQPGPTRPSPTEPIRLRIDQAGQIFWNDSPAPMSALRNMMEQEVQRDPTNQPTLEIDTNDEADYGVLAKVLATARNAQMQKIGFVKKQ